MTGFPAPAPTTGYQWTCAYYSSYTLTPCAALSTPCYSLRETPEKEGPLAYPSPPRLYYCLLVPDSYNSRKKNETNSAACYRDAEAPSKKNVQDL